MTSRHARRENIQRRQPILHYKSSAWRNWVKNGFRKASQIDFTGNGYCVVAKISTPHGDIFSLTDRSPVIIRNMRSLITDLYKSSGETAPIFVDIHIFKRIQAVEHG